jgi:tape measure domain-containing protein
MKTIADLMVKIGADTSDFQKQMKATQRQLKTTFGSSGLEFSKTLVAGVTAANAVLAGLGAYAVKLAGNFQNAQVAFTNMLGSADKANAFIADLQQFAAKTPFNFSGLTQASQKMLAYGFTAEQIIPTLTAVGDAAAGLGAGQEGIDRITLALGQMGAKGKVSAEEMLQLTETGLPAWQMLADKMGTSISDAMDQVTKGTVSAQTGITALVEGMESKFGGLMAQQAGTIQGSWSNLMDSLEQSATQLGLRISAALNLPQIFGSLSDTIQGFASDLQSSGISTALDNLIPPGLQIAIVAVSGAIIGGMIPALISMGIAAAAAMVPLLPYIAVGAAVAAAIYAVLDPADAFVAVLQLTGTSASDASAALTYYGGIVDNVTSATCNFFDETTGLTSALEDVSNGLSDAASFFDALGRKIDEVAGKVVGLRELLRDIKGVGQTLGVYTPFGPVARTLFGVPGSDSAGNVPVLSNSGESGDGGYGATVALSSGGGHTAPDYSNFAGAGSGSGGGGADKAAADAKRLTDEAKRTTKQIADAWTNMFGTEQDQADQWYADQIANLDKTKDANSNYDADLQKINEMYWQKQAKADQAAAEKKIQLYKQIHSAALDSMSTQNVYGTASQQAIKTMEMDYTKSIDSIKAKWQEYETDYIGMTYKERQQLLKALDDEGIAYEVTEDGKLSMAKQTAADIAAANKKYDDQVLQYHTQAKDLQADVDDAYSKSSLSALRDALTQERAARLASYNEQQSIMQQFYGNWVTINETTAQKIAETISSSKQSFQTFFEDVLGGSKSFGDSLFDLFDGIWKNIIDNFTAKWTAGISNQLMSMLGLLGDSGSSSGNNGLSTGDAITGIIGQASVTGGQGESTSGITALNTTAQTAASALSLFGGTTSKGSTLLSGYNVVQGVINATTKPAEAAVTASATVALTSLTTAAISASAALAAMSAKTSLGLLGFATGGYISGVGTSTSDSIPAALSNGEYVLTAATVNRIGVPALDALNNGKVPKFAAGGLVTRPVGKINTSAMTVLTAADEISGVSAGGQASGANITLQVSALDASSFMDFLDRGGGDVIKQKLYDINRNFASTAGVW